jgi:tRNA pseudouridine65 synthase
MGRIAYAVTLAPLLIVAKLLVGRLLVACFPHVASSRQPFPRGLPRYDEKSALDCISAINTSSSRKATSSFASFEPPIQILDQNELYLVVAKPPTVVVHHSYWAGLRETGEKPMLQRVRDQVGRRVNLVHRLDRAASGCLLMTFVEDTDTEDACETLLEDRAIELTAPGRKSNSIGATRILAETMADKTRSTKTYVAFVRGEGILRGRDFKEEDWFAVDRPIKNERGKVHAATTAFRFVAGQHSSNGGKPERARASLVLARPDSGRWHQVRKHLNCLSHPILGDTSHGDNKVNKEWREKRGLPPERIYLHLGRLQLSPTDVCPMGIDVTCPLAPDMMLLLQNELPAVLAKARPILEEEGIIL